MVTNAVVRRGRSQNGTDWQSVLHRRAHLAIDKRPLLPGNLLVLRDVPNARTVLGPQPPWGALVAKLPGPADHAVPRRGQRQHVPLAGRAHQQRPHRRRARRRGTVGGTGLFRIAVHPAGRARRVPGRPLQQTDGHRRLQGGRDRHHGPGGGGDPGGQPLPDVRHRRPDGHAERAVRTVQARQHSRNRPLRPDLGRQRAGRHDHGVGRRRGFHLRQPTVRLHHAGDAGGRAARGAHVVGRRAGAGRRGRGRPPGQPSDCPTSQCRSPAVLSLQRPEADGPRPGPASLAPAPAASCPGMCRVLGTGRAGPDEHRRVRQGDWSRAGPRRDLAGRVVAGRRRGKRPGRDLVGRPCGAGDRVAGGRRDCRQRDAAVRRAPARGQHAVGCLLLELRVAVHARRECGAVQHSHPGVPPAPQPGEVAGIDPGGEQFPGLLGHAGGGGAVLAVEHRAGAFGPADLPDPGHRHRARFRVRRLAAAGSHGPFPGLALEPHGLPGTRQGPGEPAGRRRGPAGGQPRELARRRAAGAVLAPPAADDRLRRLSRQVVVPPVRQRPGRHSRPTGEAVGGPVDPDGAGGPPGRRPGLHLPGRPPDANGPDRGVPAGVPGHSQGFGRAGDPDSPGRPVGKHLQLRAGKGALEMAPALALSGVDRDRPPDG